MRTSETSRARRSPPPDRLGAETRAGTGRVSWTRLLQPLVQGRARTDDPLRLPILPWAGCVTSCPLANDAGRRLAAQSRTGATHTCPPLAQGAQRPACTHAEQPRPPRATRCIPKPAGSLSAASRLGLPDERCHSCPESVSQSGDDRERRVSLPSLQQTDVGPVQLCVEREPLLGDAHGLPAPSQGPSEALAEDFELHGEGR